MFQSENIDVTKLYDDLILMIKRLMAIIVTPRHLEMVKNDDLINLEFADFIKPTNTVNFGYDFHSRCDQSVLNKDFIMYVKERCKAYIIEMIKQLQKRLPDNIKILQMFYMFNPINATSMTKNSVGPIAAKYRKTFDDMDELENEWQGISQVNWNTNDKENIVKF